MNIILCNSCGKIMSRYTIKCTTCNGTDLETFKDPNSPKLKEKLRAFAGGNEGSHPVVSAVLVLVVAMAFSCWAYTNGEHAHPKTASVRNTYWR